jgi:hypothetical protein
VKIVLNYYKKLSNNHNRENDYLKGLVIPVEIKRKKLLDNKKSKSLSFNYCVELNNKRQKCVKMLSFNCIKSKKSRLVSKIQNNRETSEDLRGKHENQWNKLPQEVLDDFITNLPSRESHYSPKSDRNRKHLSSDLNISKLYENFITLFSEYEKVVSYDFFLLF